MLFSRNMNHLTTPLRPRIACALRLGSIFHPSRQLSSSTAYLLRTPPPSAPREVPTPLVFVSSGSWDPSSRNGMSRCASWFAEKGFTSLELDLGRPADVSTSEALMKHYESELASHIRLLAIPFAPVIVACAAGTLIAQTYISSYPASALLLISPPPSNSALAASDRSLLPTALPEFDFEPRFPVAVMATEQERPVLEKESRLWKDPDVDKLVVRDDTGLTGQEGLARIEEWLDELGF
ncbi:hypothetical protein V8D89_002809 [Ganoderma adspersum]